MIYESRVYHAVPGKLPNINARFANHTMGFFNQYEIGMMGFWTDEIGQSNQLTYILNFDSMADREEKWGRLSGRPGLGRGAGRDRSRRTAGRQGG